MFDPSVWTGPAILTGCIAVYGAALGTFNFYVARRAERPRLRIIANERDLIGMKGNVPRKAGYVISVSVTNTGSRPVNIVLLRFARCGRLFGLKKPYLAVISLIDKKPYPINIESEQNYSFECDPDLLAKHFKLEGYKGNQKVVAHITDTAGRIYLSNSFTFDPEDLLGHNSPKTHPTPFVWERKGELA